MAVSSGTLACVHSITSAIKAKDQGHELILRTEMRLGLDAGGHDRKLDDNIVLIFSYV
jgi:hypothetical protein